jgi:hypothetical protein
MSKNVTKGVNLWRTGKDGAGSVPRQKPPGGGEAFEKTSRKSAQFKGGSTVGGGGANLHASLDNHSVFANSTAGLAVDDKPFMPDPGKGRAGLDMYSTPDNSESFGLHMSKEGPRKRDHLNEED